MRTLISFVLIACCTLSAWGAASPKRIFGAPYPRLAHLARIQGPVRLEATISGAGAVDTVKVIAGNALLAPAAVESLKRWVFAPCGEPTCNFEVKFESVLETGECPISECPNETEFAWPDTVIIRSKYAKPIIN